MQPTVDARSSALMRATVMPRHREILLLMVPAVLLGAVVRLVPMLTVDFPLNDGGLFVVMSEDLRSAGFVLPEATTYNLDSIPFAYPPLALYLVAGLAGIGFDPFALARWIPFVASVATIPLVYLVSNELINSWRAAAVAAMAFALIPRGYEWLITGGGLTRGPGMVAALITVWLGLRLIKGSKSLARLVLTGVCGGVTALTHPEASVFVAVTLAVFLMSAGRSWGSVRSVLLAGAIGLITSAPWWVTVLSVHGPSVLIGAADSRTVQFGYAARQFIFGNFTGASDLNIFLGLGFIGLLLELARRRYFVPVWLVAIAAIIVSAGFTFAALPWAILMAIGVTEVVVPTVGRLAGEQPRVRLVVVGGLLAAGALSSLATGYSTASPLHGLSTEQREAMEWVRTETAVDATFVIVSGTRWQHDATSEWFPVIARRHSLATVQGYEWTDEFADRAGKHQLLQDLCAFRTLGCVQSWLDHFDLEANYIYVPKGQLAGLASPGDCCPALREDLTRSLEVVYDGDGATVFAWSAP